MIRSTNVLECISVLKRRLAVVTAVRVSELLKNEKPLRDVLLRAQKSVWRAMNYVLLCCSDAVTAIGEWTHMETNKGMELNLPG